MLQVELFTGESTEMCFQAVGPAVLMQVKLGSQSDRYRALAWEQHRAQMVSQQLGTKQYTALHSCFSQGEVMSPGH